MSIVTLYKNTQTEGDKTYKDLWALSPYEPLSLFDCGFTSEQAEYIVPDCFGVGKDSLDKDDYLYEIFTNPAGKPGIKIMNGSGIFCNELKKPGEKADGLKEEPKQMPVQKSSGWIPQMINGEWEIY